MKRKAGTTIIDLNSDGESDVEVATEIAWLRRRRSLTTAGAAQASSSTRDVAEPENEFFTDKHKKEVDFNLTKEGNKRTDALRQNFLLPKEITSDVLQYAETRNAQVNKRDKERVRENRKRAQNTMGQPPAADDLRGKNIFVDDDVASDALTQMMRTSGMVQVQERSAAQAIDQFRVQWPAASIIGYTPKVGILL